MDIQVKESNVKVMLETWTSQMSEVQLSSIASTFSKALDCILDDPQQPIQNLDLFSEHDRAQVFTWNNAYPETVDACIHDLFLQRVKANPHATAVCSWDYEDLTYSELNEFSDKLAYHLVGLGIGPEVIVPFCFDKSAWAIVTILAILKAGGACTALNPAFPETRLAGIIKDTGAKIIVAAPSHASLLQSLGPLIIVVDQESLSKMEYIPESNISHIDTQPSNTAFVVFTSGSTGVPKVYTMFYYVLYALMLE